MAKPVRCLRTYENELDYRDKLVLAPMVRTGSLPTVSVTCFRADESVFCPSNMARVSSGLPRSWTRPSSDASAL